MHPEWTVECGAADPVLVVPWSDASGKAAFVDLRAHPTAIDTIPEAEAHPPLMQALRALNATRSPMFTAKCDAWEMGEDEIAQLRLDLGIGIDFEIGEDVAGGLARSEDDVFVYGFASYIDCIFRDRGLFASFPRHEHLLRGISRRAARFDHPQVVLECTLRPAFVHLDTPRQGYAVTMYVKALGESPQRALKRWSGALAEVVVLLRSRENMR